MNSLIKFQRKLLNVYVFFYLIQLSCHNIYDYKYQNKQVKKLMKYAYRIPIYRKKFESVGLKPKDFNCDKDLMRFPLLEKRELRQWIKDEETSNPQKYKYWFKESTSGSSGSPLTLYVTPKEQAKLNANWIRIITKQGINPFIHKTLAIRNPRIVPKGGGRQCSAKIRTFEKKNNIILDAY